MVADKIEMSLDDIIKSTKTMSVNKRGGAAAGGRRGGARGAGGRSNGTPGGAGGRGVQKGAGRQRGGGIAKAKFSRVR